MTSVDHEHYLLVEGIRLGPETGPDSTGSFQRLERALDEVSRLHRRILRTPLDLVSGLTFQALLREPSALPRLIAALEAELPGVPLRFGLGWGELTTPLRGRVHHMHGPAFLRAHEALQAAARKEAWACARGFPRAQEAILDGLLHLMGAVRERWKPRQRETIALARRHRRLKDVARARGVTPPTVSRSLDGALFQPMLSAEKALSTALQWFTIENTRER